MAELSNSVAGDVLSEERFKTRIDTTPDEIEAFCKRWHVAELALFGSVLRDDFNSHSDIDVLVVFESGETPGFRFVTMATELSRLFGRRVDVLTRSSVEQSANYIRRKGILEVAKVIYRAR